MLFDYTTLLISYTHNGDDTHKEHKEITIRLHHDEKQWYMQYVKILVGCISFNPNIPNISIVTYKRKHVYSAKVVKFNVSSA